VQVQGNYIGTDYTGTKAVANDVGVEVDYVNEFENSNNTIGGTVAGARNVISGNTYDGVHIVSGVSGVQVQGNYIGTDVTGISAVANSIGIEIAGNSNTVGGGSSSRNIIFGNSGDGVLIDSSASGNLVGGNIFGLNASGSTALANSGNGVEIQGTNNTVGGPVLAARNYISGNSKDGVLLGSSASGNLVLGGWIGLNISGTLGVANLDAVEIAGNSKTLGSTISGGFNFISSNRNDGVLIDTTAKNNIVQNNDIGTDQTGQKGIANSIGIEVAGVGTTIGGTASGARNIVSGNKSDGVKLDSTGSGTVLLGNSIGINAALGNGGNGLDILSSSNTIGGTASAARNIISANANDGVLLASGANGNLALNNFVGVDLTGSKALTNSANGIEIASTGNTIGSTASAAQNQISGNTNDGVLLDSTASGNLVQGDNIGVNRSGATLANSGNGVEIAGNNTVGGSASGVGNIISGNSKSGVLVSAGSGDTISRDSIFANGALGISLASGANNNIVAPTLSSAILSGTTLTVNGSFAAPTANVAYVLEFFANLSGDAEGKMYLGALTVAPTTTGTQSFSFTTTTTVTGTYPLITATLTDNTADTSAFSSGVWLSQLSSSSSKER